MTIPKCTSWLGHKFEGRYSSEPREGDFNKADAEGRSAIDALLRMRVNMTYECDICVRCGVKVMK